MLLGKPIVMTRVSDYDKLVDETNGYLCDWDDSDSIFAAISNLVMLSDEGLLLKGKASKNKAGNMFSAERNIIKWMDLIN